MKNRLRRERMAVLGLCALLAATSAEAAARPSPVSAGLLQQFPYAMNGLVSTSSSTGSAVVVYHPRTAISAAHVVFDESRPFDPWQNDGRFYLRHHSATGPSFGSGVPFAGFFYYSGYADAVRRYGGTGDRTYHLDLVVHYGFEDLAGGGWAGWWTNGDGVLANRAYSKLVVGYPSGLYSFGHPYLYLMHQTGPFVAALKRRYGDYYTASGASTGPGNSGGPVYGWSANLGQWLVAGVLVSGQSKLLGDGRDVVGVRAMDKGAWKLVKKAIPDDVRPWVSISTPSAVSARSWAFSGTASDDQLVDWVKVRVVKLGRNAAKWNKKKSDWVKASLSGPRDSRTWSATLKVPKKGSFELQARAHDRKKKGPVSEATFSQ
ncbi:MAG: trypsin-like serine peptidase [Myxococcota bacterium]